MHPTNTGPIIFNFGVFLKEKRRKEKREREREQKVIIFPTNFTKMFIIEGVYNGIFIECPKVFITHLILMIPGKMQKLDPKSLNNNEDGTMILNFHKLPQA